MSELGSQPESGALTLIPWPASVDQGLGSLTLTSAQLEPEFEAAESEILSAAVGRLADDVAQITKLPAGDPVPIRIRTSELTSAIPGLEEDESYWLVVDDAGIYLDAATQDRIIDAVRDAIGNA